MNKLTSQCYRIYLLYAKNKQANKNQTKTDQKKKTQTNKQKNPKTKAQETQKQKQNKKDQKRPKPKIFSIVVNKKRQKSAFFQQLFWNFTSDTKPIQYVQWRQIRLRK